MNFKFTLVPADCFSEDSARELLGQVVSLQDGEPLSFLEVPQQDAVLVYAGAERPLVYDLILSLYKARGYNKILFSWTEGSLSLVVAQGERLIFCNCFRAADFTTAEYYIFMTLRSLQINPEISSIWSAGPIPQEGKMSLYNYFKSVEEL